jgi:CDP-paratose 2-epimerase
VSSKSKKNSGGRETLTNFGSARNFGDQTRARHETVPAGFLMERILVTHFSGSLGNQLCRHFREKEFIVDGVDTFLPGAFRHAPMGSPRYQAWLDCLTPGGIHYELDICRRDGVMELIKEIRPKAVIHCVPPLPLDHEKIDPAGDCDLIINGTLNFLEAMRQFCWQSPFIFLSTDKVYGDRTNTLRLDEKESRWDFADSFYEHGVSEEFPIDHSTHSVYGAAAAAADLLVQEYGRSFHLPTCCLRGPVATDPSHPDGVVYDLLRRLVQANIDEEECLISGHGIKQVREVIHGCDVAQFIEFFCAQPRTGEVYNLGGGRENSYSILEASRLVERQTGHPMRIAHRESIPLGEHICYFSDLRKIQRDYPEWRLTRFLPQIIKELVEGGSSLAG